MIIRQDSFRTIAFGQRGDVGRLGRFHILLRGRSMREQFLRARVLLIQGGKIGRGSAGGGEGLAKIRRINLRKRRSARNGLSQVGQNGRDPAADGREDMHRHFVVPIKPASQVADRHRSWLCGVNSEGIQLR